MEDQTSNLRRIREVNWEEVEAEEARLLQQMPIEESIREYLALQAEFEPMLSETDALFRPEREATLFQLQARLQILEAWREKRVDSLAESLIRLQSLLDKANIPSATIGGLAVSAWGEARLTRDVDLKVLLSRDSRRRLLDLLAADYLFIHADPDEALRLNGVVFIRDALGTRLDILLADTNYDELLIARARMVEVLPGKKARVCSPEDLIVLKMIASRPHDWGDVASVVQRQGEQLDDAYILDWLGQFEQALADSTLRQEYRRIRSRYHRMA